MRISDLNTSTQILRQASMTAPTVLDAKGKLYRASLEKISPKLPASPAVNDGDAFIYSRTGIRQATAIAPTNVILENADGSRFSVDTIGKTLSLVAKGKNIELYVFTPNSAAAGSPNNSQAVKYSFDGAGVMSANGAVTNLTAMDLSDAEIATRRDLDGNGKVGGDLSTAVVSGNGSNSGKRVAVDGVFKVNVMDRDLFVVGAKSLEKQKNINAKGSTLLNADGSGPWSPVDSFQGVTFSSYRAVKTNANNISWTVYATNASTGEVARFQFDNDLKLNETSASPVMLSGAELIDAEASSKRDFNADGVFGAKINSATDAAGGLYQADFLGATVYLSKVSATQTDTTGGLPVNADGQLLLANGTAWAGAGNGYQIASMVKSGQNGVNRTVYAYAMSNGVADRNNILKFNFTASGNNFTLDANSAVGIAVSATEMASAEKTAKRDLNGDQVFGVNINASAVDAQGGLYKGTMLGKEFYIAGSGLRTGSTGSLARDLTGALVNADGTAWAPATGYSVASLVAERANNVVTGYTAYAYKSGNAPDRTDLLKYSFAASGSNWQVSAATQFGVAVNAADLAAAESTTSRDLNGDGKFGVDLQLTALDSEGGLYKGQAFGQTYVLAGTNLSSSANGALNLSKALLNADGTAWAPSALSDATAKLRVIVSGAGNQASYDVYLTTNQGSQLTSGVGTATYNKYTFDHNYTLVGNSQSLTTEEFAAAEKAAAKDLNADQKFGVNITSAVDARGGLYRGSLDSKGGVYFWGSANLTPGSKVAADALDFDSALKTAAGFWTPDSGYTVKSAVNDSNSNSLTVIAVNGTNDIKKYVFDTSASGKSTLQGADSGDMGLADLVSLENTATRDLNGDGIVGVSITATHDALGGLFKVSAGNKTIVSLGGANAVAPTDLDKALLATDGSFWSATGTVDRYVLVSAGAGANATYTVYTKAGSDYTEYTFGADYTLDASKTRSTLAANDASGAATLDAIKLADLEKDSGRDINGDSVVGAKVTKTLVANTLYEASMNGNTYTVMNQSMSGNTTRLVDASLRNADGSRWSVDAAYTIKAALVNTVGGSTASTEVYAINGSNAGKRYSFDAKGTLLKADAVTAEQIANAGNLGSLNPSSVDAIGGLFKATVLGADFYVVGSGAGNATAPTDLSQALLIGRNGNAAAWSPNTGAGNNGADGTGFKVAGLVANLTNNAADSYDVYAYKTNASGDVTDVFKSSWDNNFLYQGTVRADPAALVDVESGTGRDLNADGAIGFRLVGADATQATFKGVSVGQVGGYSATYLLAGTDLTPGTASAPLGMDKALLNQAGTAAWMPDSSYKVMAVTDGSSNSTRYVYALKAGANGARDEYLRYEFTKATGKSIGAGVAISATEMAAREVNDIKDLTGDGQVGVVSVSDYRVLESGNPTGASTGLLKANFGGKTYFVVNSMPSNGGKLDLSKALLASDGVTPWSIPTSNGSASFAIKGIYENNQGTSNNSNDDILEVYGTDNSGDVQSFKFSKQVDSAGNYTGAYIQMLASIGSTTPNDLTGFQLARAEYASTVDLNADGIVGFKASATPYKIESPSLGSYSLGQASVGSSQIYFVTDNYAVAKADPSGAAVKAGALMVNDGTTLDVGLGAGLSYWSPVSSDSTVAYDVKSIVSLNAGGNVEVWAEQTTNGTSDGYVKFAFARDANNNWVLDNSSYAASNALTEDEVIAEEANGGYTADSNYQVSGDYAARDINADGVVGLRLGSVSASGATSSVYKASIGSSDYYLVGTDLSSGTETNPLKLDTTRILMNNAGSSVWSPTGAVSGWSTVDPQTALALVAGGMADTPTYQLDDGGTTVYFTYDSNASLFRVAA